MQENESNIKIRQARYRKVRNKCNNLIKRDTRNKAKELIEKYASNPTGLWKFTSGLNSVPKANNIRLT